MIIAVTDGGDTTSYKHYDDALAAAQRADAVLYPIVVVPIPSEAGRNTGGEHALETLAASTGGRIFYPQSFSAARRGVHRYYSGAENAIYAGFLSESGSGRAASASIRLRFPPMIRV